VSTAVCSWRGVLPALMVSIIVLVSTVVVPGGGVDAASSSRSRAVSAECSARLAFDLLVGGFPGRVGHRAVCPEGACYAR
jgi:hypothetical protein